VEEMRAKEMRVEGRKNAGKSWIENKTQKKNEKTKTKSK
jgi:hypothetical protein